MTNLAAELEWRGIPAGPFLMGSDPAAAYPPSDDETPCQLVRLEPFRISRTPVTNAQYAGYAAATGGAVSPFPPGHEDVPATYVTWADARAFCDWAAVRLPTEAEWEAAARGGDDRLWPWGDDLPTAMLAVFGMGIGSPQPAGRLPGGASVQGALDLAGNVWEWTSSAYRRYPYDPGDGRESVSPEDRVVRGGTFLHGPDELRCSYRQPMSPGARDHYVGFRVAATSREPRLDFEWTEVPGGETALGRDPVQYGGPAVADELPRHRVEVPAFSLSQTPITNRQYARYVGETGAEPPPHWAGATSPLRDHDHPVTFVDWHDAQAFCLWAGGRLPTEAEWEKAARGLDARIYPWGDEDDPSRAVVGQGMKAGRPAPVGKHEGASPYGLLDMAGNVWEWSSSRYLPYPYDPLDGREDPGRGGERVLRGGSFASPGLGYVRCAMRSRSRPERRQSHIGFRVAKDV